MSFSRSVIYDDECGFCMRWIRPFRRLDWLRKFEWRGRTEPGLYEAFPQARPDETKRQMMTIDRSGKVRGGFYAVRDIMIRLPLLAIPAALLYIPGAALVGDPAYRWVAANRHRFGGKAACSLKK